MDAALDKLVSEGEARGAEKVNRLGIKMSEAGRVNDFMKSLLDKKLQEWYYVISLDFQNQMSSAKFVSENAFSRHLSGEPGNFPQIFRFLIKIEQRKVVW